MKSKKSRSLHGFAAMVFLVVTAFSNQVVAQSLTETGWLVSNNGDTLRGTISIDRGQSNPSRVTLDRAGDRIVYGPKDIKSFQIGNTRFLSLTIDLDQSARSARDLDEIDRVTTPVRRDLFVTEVVSGKVGLLRWNDERSNPRFFLSKDGQTTELLYRVTRIEVNGTSQLSTAKVYIGQLKSLMSDCAPALDKVDRADYSETSLKNLIVLYNSCFGGVSSVATNEPKSKALWSVSVGASITQLKYGSVPTGAPTGDYQTVWKPAASFNLELIPSKLSKPWSEFTEFAYYAVSFSATSPYQGRPYFFDLQYIRANSSFRYYFGKGHVNPFIQAGIGVGYAFKRDYFAGLPADQRFQPRKIDNAFHLTTGAKFNSRYSISLRYEHGFGFSTEKFPSRFNTWSAAIGYQLNAR